MRSIAEPPRGVGVSGDGRVPSGIAEDGSTAPGSGAFVPTPIDLDRTSTTCVRIAGGWLLAGRSTLLTGEPGAGKSLLALSLCLEAIAEGHDVVIIDEENGINLVVERLRSLGCTQEVADHLHYIHDSGPGWAKGSFDELEALLDDLGNVGLVVIDSLTDVLAAARMDENHAGEVTRMWGEFRRLFLARGIALLVLDHTPKDRAPDSRYGRGSIAKAAKTDLSLMLAAVDEFGPERSGAIAVWKTKDRLGSSPVPDLTSGRWHIEVEVADGTTRFGDPVFVAVGQSGDRKRAMTAIRLLLAEDRSDRTTEREVVTALKQRGYDFKTAVVTDALAGLAGAGELRLEKRGRSFVYAAAEAHPPGRRGT